MRFRDLHCFRIGVAGAWLAFAAPAIAQHEHPPGEPEKLGTVNFPVSCDAAVQPQFNRAVAMLHSFWYEKAGEAFAVVAEKDPACGMAYWGIAMTHYHQIWEAPGPADLKQGWTAVERANSAGAKTQRERDYIGAIAIFYKDSDKLDHRARALAYERAMEQLLARYPNDREGAILEPIFAAQPEHPGVAHYLIHCYDYPSLADRALEAARRYAKIAPDSPHALHMPSHIFTRLGLWQESIASNLASAGAAQKHGAIGDELHAMDYLVYAYLQGAQDVEAKKVFHAVPQLRQTDPAHFAGLYAIASMPARYAVERHRWAEAAALPVPSNTFPGGRYAWTEANIRFARALGAARIGDTAAARKSLQQLASLRDTLTQANEAYWAEQAEIQRETASAWLALAEGKKEEALRQMRSATGHEDATDKNPVTPGVILPARELLGEMLLELRQPAQAVVEFEATLRVAPNRFNALAGAARAANLSGDRERAKSYSAKLLAICDHADGDRAELRDARTLLVQK